MIYEIYMYIWLDTLYMIIIDYMIHDKWYTHICYIPCDAQNISPLTMQFYSFFCWANPGVPPLRFTQKWFVGSWLFMLFEHWLGDSPGYDTTNTQPDAGEPWIFDTVKSHVVYEKWEKMGCQVWNKTNSGFDGNDSGTNKCIHYTCIYVTYVYVLWGIIAVEPRGMIILTKDLHG